MNGDQIPRRSRGNPPSSSSRRAPGPRRGDSAPIRQTIDRPDRSRSITAVTSGSLPRWVRDDINRSTPKDRRDATIRHLEEGIAQYAQERFRPAIEHLTQAKALSPRSSTIRELLGLASYFTERWLPALQELRAFRRLTGATTHMPVEMDCLRALGRSSDVDKTWETFRELGGDRDTEREAAVVYASHLLDRGRVADAWRVIRPGRLVSAAPESEVRSWFVAARVALAAGDKEAARKLVKAIEREQPAMPGLEELLAQI
ncbi:MAG: tetratricopeptide repeat protein [Actinomycetota bacterium]